MGQIIKTSGKISFTLSGGGLQLALSQDKIG
jgi:hypothetical protein